MKIIFNGSSGLNNVIDPAQIRPDKYGRLPLVESMNIVVGDTGRINRCIGVETVLAGNIHSIYSFDGYIYYVSNKIMYRYDGVQSENVKNLISNDPISYCRSFDGVSDVLHFSNGIDFCEIVSGSCRAWEKGEYHGPEETLEFIGPVPGHLIAWILNRMFIAVGSSVYMSEPNNPYLYELMSGRITLDGRIRMLAGVFQGFWLSDSKSIYFVQSDGNEFQFEQKTGYPAIEGEPVQVELGEIGAGLNMTGIGYIVPTIEGLCLCGPQGFILNLTKDSVELRNSDRTPINWTRYAAIKDRSYIYFYADGIGLILNLVNLAVTQHDCYPFNSFCIHNGILHGANNTGIYSLTGGDVNAYYIIYLDMQRLCNLRFLYYSGEFAGNMETTITSDENIEKIYESVLPRLFGMKQHNFKVPVQRANGKGRYWKVKTENLNGSDFSVDQMEITFLQKLIYRSK